MRARYRAQSASILPRSGVASRKVTEEPGHSREPAVLADDGNVHADQFSMYRSFGNIKQRKFSDIWQDTTNPIMAGLKDRLPKLEGRCAKCKFKEVCGGSLRARAEVTTDNPWAPDPLCYLTDEEIGYTPEPQEAPAEPAGAALSLPVLN